jgi:hypothetical protein
MASTEGDDWATIVAGGSKAVVGQVQPPSSKVTDFDRVIDQPADLKSNIDTAAIASSHRTTTAAMYSIHSLLSENHP